jgi:hypothetical protein
VNEIELFTRLAPPPPTDTQEMKAGARARLVREITQSGALTGAVPADRKRRRRRRRIALGIAVAAAAVCAAIVVPAVLPGSAPASFVTKAWAVQRNPDGTVTLQLSKFAFDGAGLQQALQADGVPALVRYRVVNDPSYQVTDPGEAPGVCRPAASSEVPAAVQAAVISLRLTGVKGGKDAQYVIHPSAMPTGSVLYVSSATIDTSSPGRTGAFSIGVLKHDRLPPCAG